jgi:hypothetical protein
MNDRIGSWLRGLREKGKPDEFEAKNLLRAYGLASPEGVRLLPGDDPEDAVGLCPAALKVCSPRILHKTDLDGVKLKISRDRLAEEVDELRLRFPSEPILVERMSYFQAPEFIVGGLQDPTFGPAVVVGAGGILTEIYHDVASRLAPCCFEDAVLMLEELTLSPLFHGYRNLSFDRDGFARFITEVSTLIADGEGVISQMDLNPVVFTGRGWLVLDAKIILVSDEEA